MRELIKVTREKMTAAVLYGKRDVRIEQIPIPRVEAGEVLVRIKAALTCGTDLKVYRQGFHARMIVPPAVFGHELAGVVEEVGEGPVAPNRAGGSQSDGDGPGCEADHARRGEQVGQGLLGLAGLGQVRSELGGQLALDVGQRDAQGIDDGVALTVIVDEPVG